MQRTKGSVSSRDPKVQSQMLTNRVQVGSWKEQREQKSYMVRGGDFILKVSEEFQTENGFIQAF